MISQTDILPEQRPQLHFQYKNSAEFQRPLIVKISQSDILHEQISRLHG